VALYRESNLFATWKVFIIKNPAMAGKIQEVSK